MTGCGAAMKYFAASPPVWCSAGSTPACTTRSCEGLLVMILRIAQGMKAICAVPVI